MKKKYSTTPILYFANPYSHKYKKVMQERYELVDRAAARLLKLGIMTYPPIALNARWTKYEDFGHDWRDWAAYDRNFLERCDGLVVLKLDGWIQSVGVQSEIAYAKELKIPICYISYEEIMNNKINPVLLCIKEIQKKKGK